MKESDLQIMVADYLSLRYPDVIFHSDFGSGIKLTIGQAAKQKRQNGGRRAWPDMFIARARSGALRFGPFISEYDNHGDLKSLRQDVSAPENIAFGLFIELKKEGTRLKKKNGEWATQHIAEQAFLLEQLRSCGYMAVFACGFDEAKKIIDYYLADVEII